MRKYFLACLLASLPASAQVAPNAHVTKSQPATKSHPTTESELQQELQHWESETVSLLKRVKDLENQVEALNYLVGKKQDRQDSVTLDTSKRMFQRLDTDVGFFLILVKDVSPYLNGYKVRLNVGNVWDSAFSGVKIKTKWSKPYDWQKYTESSYKEWLSSLHELETPITDDLEPGTWNTVELILTPAGPDDLGYLEVSMDTDTVKMRTVTK